MTANSTPNQRQPTFVLGVGAQKAGTTWLHHYLDNDPSVNTGCLKEYHVWDAVFHPDRHSRLTKLVTNPDRPQNAVRRLLQSCPGAYEAYFSGLLNERIRITADITPSYSGLSAEQFCEIRRKLEGSGFYVKVVFLMREPAQRCWSAAKMSLKNRDLSRKEQSALASQVYLSTLQKEGVRVRTRYERTIKELDNAFDSKQLYFGFYENMFDSDSIRKLSDFLDVENRPALTKEIVNKSAKLPLSKALRDECRREYDQTYQFCYDRFPVTQTLWDFL